MGVNKYIKLYIDYQELDVDPDNFPVAISYKIEDPDNFQVKTSADALEVPVPATLNNDAILNTFHNPSVEDLSNGSLFRTFRNCVLEERGQQILVGQALLTKAKHTNKPTGYELNLYGNNADWIILLKDTTLYDFLKTIQLNYTTSQLIASWAFDGTDPTMPYVFAPVRYMLPFDDIAFAAIDTVQQKSNHYITNPEYLAPSLSIYWILYNAFKSIGYQINSAFFNTSYFRKMVMPWVFGAFPSSNGTKQDIHNFTAASYNTADTTGNNYFSWSGNYSDYVDLNPIAPPTLLAPIGTFDNNYFATGISDYTYNTSTKQMKWTYQPNQNFGLQKVGLSLELGYLLSAGNGNNAVLYVEWTYVNGATGTTTNIPANSDGSVTTDVGNVSTSFPSGESSSSGPTTVFCTYNVNPGDSITAKVFLYLQDEYNIGGGALAVYNFKVNAFSFNYLSTPINAGGTVNFDNYLFFKQYKFTDFFSGVIDLFNLSFQADPTNQIITIEPTHDYSLTNDQSNKSGGYMNSDFFNWMMKQDLSKESELQLYSDGNREYIFSFADDSADGCLKVVQDRIQQSYQYKQDLIANSINSWQITKSTLASSKYILPNRFAKDNTVVQNRFFAPCMHYVETNWADSNGMNPQLICIIPENISNTSANEASNTFKPKIAFYKGNITGAGGWKMSSQVFTPPNTTTLNPYMVHYDTFPFMFGVNYHPGGENDPILSYSDENIKNVIGIGLMRRFFLQRMAIMRNGQWYNTFFKLNNNDVGNLTHREHIIIAGQKWELLEVQSYKPGDDTSTQCLLRKWTPINETDDAAVYPTRNSIVGTPNSTDPFETKYTPLMCLSSDIPQQ
jgi:hypothetical protein